MIMQEVRLAQILQKYKACHAHPFVLEVLGTPNAGKTPAINNFKAILDKAHLSHRIVYEVGNICKIEEKLSPEFNLWTLNETISQLMDAYTSNCDIIICERGLMDALCWFMLYFQSDMLGEEEFHILHDYITLNRLRKYEDCCFIMKCSVETSLKREQKRATQNHTGRIVNTTILQKYNYALDQVIEQYGNQFRNVIMLDTTQQSVDLANSMFVTTVLEYLEAQYC